MFECAEEAGYETMDRGSGLFPHWIYTGADPDKFYSGLVRYCYYYPASRESKGFERARKSVDIYRSLLGESEQYKNMDLVQLNENLTKEEIEALNIDLSPISRDSG